MINGQVSVTWLVDYQMEVMVSDGNDVAFDGLMNQHQAGILLGKQQTVQIKRINTTAKFGTKRHGLVNMKQERHYSE